jgi:hypothetical protein
MFATKYMVYTEQFYYHLLRLQYFLNKETKDKGYEIATGGKGTSHASNSYAPA